MKRAGDIAKQIGDAISRENTANTLNTEPETAPCPICNGLGYLRANVPVEHADFGKLVPCTCQLSPRAERRLDALRALSNLDVMARLTFDTFTPDAPGLPPDKRANLRWAYEEASDFAKNPQGWLVLKGGYGCGKTHLAAAIANYRVMQGQPALFIVVPDLLDHLRATFTPQSAVTFDQRFEEVRRAPLLILDDLGTESATPWAREKLYQIFDYRYNARLPTVITTATPIEELDPRLATRMLDVSRCTPFAILAPAYRGGAPRRKKATRRR